MYLLDTNVISEIGKGARADSKVRQWAEKIEHHEMFTSVLVIMEIEKGILLKERKDPEQAKLLRSWFTESVMKNFDGRVLEINVPIALCCAKMHVPDRKSMTDSLIAATAMVNAMTLVTRNTADFAQTGTVLHNPWL
ncbi:type II toxin-antitoxin system VapC family toxin [Sodalis ligni]|uniref:PIN domain-containing protein n=1 Tax=Sodalis ligni TaxID=2697027 RepID=A0A4R1NMQ5_9GAMM|nr:type II toxin-antitoxin system VapC family toxin [Sodalis ligni]TCL07321.1 hypothetical protein EZJ58_5636 [Sodalis ligni]